MRLPCIVIVLGAVLLAGCGGPGDILPIAPRPATLADLTGPWRETPLLLDATWRTRIVAACRRDMQAGAGAAPGIIDARGADVVTVRLTGGNIAKCDALHVQPNGEVVGAGGGTSGGPENAALPGEGTLGPIEAGFVLGGSLTVKGWSVTGRAGAGIARVEVVTSTQPPIVATLENGWFSAWWQAAPGDRRPDQGRLPDFAVRGYDVSGALVSER